MGSWAEQTAYSMCNSQISCFSPCKLLRGKEEAVSLQSHLHLSLSSCFLQGKSACCVLHRQSLACRIPGCTFPGKSHQCRCCCPEGEVITPFPPHMALSCAIVVGPSLSHVRPFATPWTAAHQASLSFTISRSLLKVMSIESPMPSNHLILCRPLLLPSIFPSIRVLFNELALPIRWQNIGASASTSELPMHIQGWFPLGLTGLISWLSKGLSRIFSSTTVRKHQFFSTHPSLWYNSYICTLSELSRCWAVFCRKKKRSPSTCQHLCPYSCCFLTYHIPCSSWPVEIPQPYTSRALLPGVRRG